MSIVNYTVLKKDFQITILSLNFYFLVFGHRFEKATVTAYQEIFELLLPPATYF